MLASTARRSPGLLPSRFTWVPPCLSSRSDRSFLIRCALTGLGRSRLHVFLRPEEDLRNPERARPQAHPAAGRERQRARGIVPGALRSGTAGGHSPLPRAARRRRTPRRTPARGLRRRARGGPPHPRHAALRRPDHRRHGPPPGPHRRDEDRRGEDPRGDASRVPQRPHGARGPRGDGQRLPGASRLGVDGGGLPVPGNDGRRHRPRPQRPPSGGPPTRPTSPTGPTTSSASTTCATT